MKNTTINSITPFVPAKDFELSLRFYKDLGFVEVVKIENSVRLEIDGYGFWLQDYYVKDWADNSMLCIYVQNLASWWLKVKELNIDGNYQNTAKVLSEPHEQEGSQMMQLTDPSGVLWHVRQGS